MADVEKLKFKVGLSGSSSKKKPEFSLGIDGKEFVRATLTVGPNVTEYFEFECELEEAEHTLEITLINKLPMDTLVDKDGNIIEDMLLGIESIEIDGIEMDSLKWNLSKYYPIYPESYQNEQQKQIKEVKKCVDLGWNGSWQFPFSSPFYIWLLENI